MTGDRQENRERNRAGDVDSGDSAVADDVTSGRSGGRQRSRRQKILRGGALLAVLGLIVLVALVPAGILGLVVNDTATFDAAPAAPDDETLSETGYERQSAEESTVEQQISAGGQERTIVVNNQRRTYERAVVVQNRSFDAGVFVTLSTPAVSIAGSPRNPIADMSDREILHRFGDQLTNGSGEMEFERVGKRDASMLGESTDVSEFRTTVSVGGEEQPVAVYLTRVRSGDDIVVAVGVHPTAFPGDRVSIFQLIHAVEHPSR